MSDSAKDLKWWSQFRGIDMAMAWPAYEASFYYYLNQLLWCFLYVHVYCKRNGFYTREMASMPNIGAQVFSNKSSEYDYAWIKIFNQTGL